MKLINEQTGEIITQEQYLNLTDEEEKLKYYGVKK